MLRKLTLQVQNYLNHVHLIVQVVNFKISSLGPNGELDLVAFMWWAYLGNFNAKQNSRVSLS